MLSDRSQTQMLQPIWWHGWYSGKGQTLKTENRSVVTSGWGTTKATETLGAGGAALYLGRRGGYMTGCICQNLKNYTQNLVSFKLYKLCLNKKNVSLKSHWPLLEQIGVFPRYLLWDFREEWGVRAVDSCSTKDPQNYDYLSQELLWRPNQRMVLKQFPTLYVFHSFIQQILIEYMGILCSKECARPREPQISKL